MFRISTTLSSLVTALLMPLLASADSQLTKPIARVRYRGDIVIREGRITEPFTFIRAQPLKRLTKVSFKIVKNNAVNPGQLPTFENGSSAFEVTLMPSSNARSRVATTNLPRIKAGSVGNESFLHIRFGRKRLRKVRLYTTSEEDYQDLGQLHRKGTKAIEYFTDNFIIFNLDQLTGEEAGTESTQPTSVIDDDGEEIDVRSSNEAVGSIDFDPNSEVDEVDNVMRGAFSCPDRAWYPKWTGSVWSSGTVRWASNPAKAGFSFKREEVDSANSETLSCPIGPYRTDTCVDGIYKAFWFTTVYKVPDHCSTYRFVRSDGVKGFYCCCNKYVKQIKGVCEKIQSTDYNNWPDLPRITCPR